MARSDAPNTPSRITQAKQDLESGATQTAQKVIIQHSGQESIALPDGSFLSRSRMSRDGQDLILQNEDGQTLVIENYFNTLEAPDLTSPGGNMLSPKLVQSFLEVSSLEFTQGFTMNDASPVGAVTEIDGSVTLVRTDGTRVDASRGTPVFEGDVVETSSEGAANITFIDKSTFAVSEDARLAIDEYVFDPSTQEGTSDFSFLKGLFVYTSGAIGESDPDDVQIETPMGSIGIRGTTIAGKIDAEGSDNQVTVLEGAIVVRNGAQEITLANQFETVQISSFDAPMQQMGQISPDDFSGKFKSLSKVSPGTFSGLNVSPPDNEGDEAGNQDPAETGEDSAGKDAAGDNAADPAGERGGESGEQSADQPDNAAGQDAESESGQQEGNTQETPEADINSKEGTKQGATDQGERPQGPDKSMTGREARPAGNAAEGQTKITGEGQQAKDGTGSDIIRDGGRNRGDRPAQRQQDKTQQDRVLADKQVDPAGQNDQDIVQQQQGRFAKNLQGNQKQVLRLATEDYTLRFQDDSTRDTQTTDPAGDSTATGSTSDTGTTDDGTGDDATLTDPDTLAPNIVIGNSSIDENSASGTVVGQTALDNSSGNVFFSLANTRGAQIFDLVQDGDSAILVFNGPVEALDHESRFNSIGLGVNAFEDGVLVDQQFFKVNVTDVQEAPEVEFVPDSAELIVDDESTLRYDVSHLFSDQDSGDNLELSIDNLSTLPAGVSVSIDNATQELVVQTGDVVTNKVVDFNIVATDSTGFATGLDSVGGVSRPVTVEIIDSDVVGVFSITGTSDQTFASITDKVFFGNSQDNVVTFSSSTLSNRMLGGDGNDSLTTLGDANRLIGGRGNDTITNENLATNSRLFGDEGNDLIRLVGTGQSDFIDGGTGYDTLLIGTGFGDVSFGAGTQAGEVFNIETLHTQNTEGQTISLRTQDIFHMSEGKSNTLRIIADDTDTIAVEHFNGDPNSLQPAFKNTGTVDDNGNTFVKFSNGDTTLLVNEGAADQVTDLATA